MAKLFAPKKAVDLLRVTLIDVSPTACDMAYINTALWGIPAKILQGNALTMSFDKGWENIHWARVGEDNRQAMLRMLDPSREIFSGGGKQKPRLLLVLRSRSLSLKKGSMTRGSSSSVWIFEERSDQRGASAG